VGTLVLCAPFVKYDEALAATAERVPGCPAPFGIPAAFAFASPAAT